MSAVKRTDGEMHPDADMVNPFLLPLVIVGGKYDEFQDLDPEKKKTVCRAVRFFAHYHGATLQFYSARDAGLVKKARDLLSHHAFSAEPGKGVSQDYNKPLIIPAWSDSFEAISGSAMSGDGRQNLELWKHQFTTHFPQSVSRRLVCCYIYHDNPVLLQVTERTALPEDPCKDLNFREPLIDELKAQKDEELDRYRREVEQKNRQWGDYFDQSVKF